MSDWLDELARLESEATEAKWYVVGPPWGDGGFIVSGNPDPHVGRYVCNTDDLLVMDDEESEEHGASNKLADAGLIAALRNNASELISRARRAEELEREVGEWRDTVSGEPPTLLRRLLAVAQSHNDPLRGLLLRVWKREQQLESENHRLFRALEACRAEMERQGMDTSTPVRELHRAGRLEDV